MRLVKIICMLVLLLLLGGCFDYNELNMQELVNGAGVDVAEDGVRVNVVCAPTSGADDKEGAKYTSEGGSFFEAVRALGSEADKKLYWGHTRCFIIGEAAAGLTDEILDTVLRVQDVYLDIAPVIAKGTDAEAIASSKMPGGGDVFEGLSNMLANEANSRRFSAMRVWEILRAREGGGVYILPTVSLREDAPYLSGGAVMRDGRIAGYLTGEQMLLLSLMTEKGAGGYLPTLTLPGGGQASFEILANDIKKRMRGDAVEIRVSCVLSPAGVRGKTNSNELRESAQRYLESGFSGIIAFAEENELGDIFGTDGKTPQVSCDITVSNILGGKE